MPTADGRGCVRDFQGGSIYWSPATGANVVFGDIRVKWAQLGGERAFLGFPVADELATPDGVGRFNHFECGSIEEASALRRPGDQPFSAPMVSPAMKYRCSAK